METSHPLQTPEAVAFFEAHRQGFLDSCEDTLQTEASPLLREGLLFFYDAIYRNVVPAKEKVLRELDPLRASLVLAKGWLYLLGKAKDELWLRELVEALNSSKFAIDSPLCCKEPYHVKSVAFGEEAGIFLHSNIIDVFATIKEKNQPITFLNLFEGVPIASEGTVLQVTDEEVVFKMDPLQELAMKHDNKAYIVKNQFFSKPVKADIVFCNMVQHEVTLTNFVYLLNMPAAQRESARVHPNTVAKVALVDTKSKQTVEGILFDLSLGGIGVVSAAEHNIQAGDNVEVSFELAMPSMCQRIPVVVKALVVNVFEYNKAYRYCMKFKASPEEKAHIEQFVKEREVEVIEALKEELKEYM